MKQSTYFDKMEEITKEKVLKRPVESKEEEFPPEKLLLASTDTTYDQEPELKPTVANAGAKAPVSKQKQQDANEEEDEEPEVDTGDRDKRILGAIGLVAVLAFFGGESSVDENTMSTIMALSVFFGLVYLVGKD